MLNVLKQSGEKATDSFKKRFHQSILKLTLIYAGTLAIILIISGLVLYSAFSNRVGRRFNIPPTPSGTTQEVIIVTRQHPTAQDVQEDLFEALVIVNGLLILIAGISSYWLAKLTLQPIKESYERQQRFLSDASHELRTPLTILQIELENELHETTNSKLKENLESKLEEIKRMSKIVNNLLILSRLDDESRTTKNSLKQVSLSISISNIIRRLDPLAKSFEVSLATHQTTQDIILLIDEDLLSHAITNFIQNAIIYNNKKGKVDITISSKKKYAKIVIKDTGIGISKEDIQKIFERFYRTDKSRSRQTGGSGLGLSIAYSAINQMKGTIKIKSELAKGTTVIIQIPLI